MKRISLSEPNFSNLEKKYLIKCISSGFVSSIGKFVNLFEKKISKFINIKHCVSCINGTQLSTSL